MSFKTTVISLARNLPFLQSYRTKRQIAKFTCYILDSDQVKAAETDPELQQRLIDEQKEGHSGVYAYVERGIADFFGKAGMSQEEHPELVRDIFFCFFAYGFSPVEYFCYGLADKTPEERRRFMSENDSVIFAFRMNSVDSVMLLSDKYASYQLLKPYYRREVMAIRSPEDQAAFLAFAKRHPRFVKKIVNESCGRGVQLVDTDHLDESMKELFLEYLGDPDGVVVEEPVRQAQSLKQLNPSSVNTVRVMTLRRGGRVTVPYCFMKVGNSGSFVDNGGSGGIMVGIDEKTGALCTDGINELAQRFQAHPDSHIIFQGFQLPQWEEALDMCKQAALEVPGADWIGWDVALSDDGWLVIEANALSEVIGPQGTFQQGMKATILSFGN